MSLVPAFAAGQAVEEIVARVNSQIITRSEFLRSKDQLKDDVKQQDPTNADKVFSVRERDILRDLIDQQLLLEKGKDLGVTGDTELIKRLDQMRKDMKLETMEDLEKAATAQGISYEDFKQNMRNQIVTQKVIGDEVGSHLSIPTEEQQKFYDEHKNEMAQPETIRLSEILIAPEKPVDKPVSNPSGNNAADPGAAAGDSAKTQDPANDAAAKQAAEAAALVAAESKANDLLKQIRGGGQL
jgi:peptidyl-prolyl cis-trans isomerase SurA